MTTTALSRTEYISNFQRMPDKLSALKEMASYLQQQITSQTGDFQNLRIAPLLDTLMGLAYDVTSYSVLVRDLQTGYAVVDGGEEPIRMDYSHSKDWHDSNPRTEKSFWEWIKRKDIANKGDVLIECRSEGMLIRKNHKGLLEVCEPIAKSAGLEIALNFQ